MPPPAFPVTLPKTVPPEHSGEALPYPILRRLSSISESRAAPGASALQRGGGVVLGAREEPEPPVRQKYGVAVLGRIESIRERFYAITLNRKLRHPAIVAMSEAARHALLHEDTPR